VRKELHRYCFLEEGFLLDARNNYEDFFCCGTEERRVWLAYIYSEEEFLLVRISYKMLLNVDLENGEDFYCY
jgi:hypothetical protein